MDKSNLLQDWMHQIFPLPDNLEFFIRTVPDFLVD